jgi:hypothetical protein
MDEGILSMELKPLTIDPVSHESAFCGTLRFYLKQPYLDSTVLNVHTFECLP